MPMLVGCCYAYATVSTMCMDGEMGCAEEEDCASQTLQRLAKQLQYYKPSSVDEDIESKYSENYIGSSLGSNMEALAVRNEQYCSCASWRERRAAVLICLFEGHEGELRVILTKRSMKLSSYPGDVALPGGKMEEGDADDSATALREATEEIGLDPDMVQIVANLEPFNSQNQLRVVPVVGLLAKREDFKPVLNIDEVEVIFDAPLEMFLEEDNHRIEEREWMGWKYVLHLFEYESKQGVFPICGLTASILIRAASIIFQKSPYFNEHLPDFQQLQRALQLE